MASGLGIVTRSRQADSLPVPCHLPRRGDCGSANVCPINPISLGAWLSVHVTSARKKHVSLRRVRLCESGMCAECKQEEARQEGLQAKVSP